MIIIWCMVPEICSTTDRIFVNLNLFFPFNQKIKIMKNEKNTQRYYYLTHVYQKWHSYDVWFLRYGTWQTKLLAILGHPLPFYLTNNPKNQNFKKKKKCSEISSFCTSAPKIMIIYCPSNIACDRCNFYFSF